MTCVVVLVLCQIWVCKVISIFRITAFDCLMVKWYETWQIELTKMCSPQHIFLGIIILIIEIAGIKLKASFMNAQLPFVRVRMYVGG